MGSTVSMLTKVSRGPLQIERPTAFSGQFRSQQPAPEGKFWRRLIRPGAAASPAALAGRPGPETNVAARSEALVGCVRSDWRRR